MFFTLIIITVLNMTADNNTFVLAYRKDVGGVPVNILDALMVVGAVVSALSLMGRFHADRVHPLFKWIMVTAAITTLGAGGMAMSNNAMHRYFLMALRNFISLPIAVYFGYMALKRPSFAKWFTYVIIVSSVLSAILVIRSAGQTSEDIEWGSAFDKLRNTSLGGDAGCYAAAIALFAFAASHTKILNVPVRLVLIMVGTVGALFLPHRSTWLSIALTWAFAALLLAKVRVSRVVLSTVVGTVVVGTACMIGVAVYSQATGKDFTGWIQNRLVSMLPGEHDGVEHKAWDTRIPGTIRELQIWVRAPIFGGGFSISDTDMLEHQHISYRHNTWTSFLAETGVFGFAVAAMTVFGLIVVGRRMVRDATDNASVMLGAIGASIGVYYLLSGMMSLTFNIQRHALDLGIACGVVLRCRAMQLTRKRMAAEGALYEAEYQEQQFQLMTPAEYEGSYQPAHW